MYTPPDDQKMQTYAHLMAQATSAWFPLIDRLPMWFWACDENYNLTYLSPNLTKVTGLSPSRLLGYCILEKLRTADRSNPSLEAYYNVLLKHEPFEGLCYERLLKTGERVVLMDSGLPVFDDAGVFKGYNGVSFHLSQAVEIAGETASLIYTLKSRADKLEQELSHRNAELEASNKLLNEVVDAMGQGLIVSSGVDLNDPDNKVVMVNPAYRELFDVTEDEIRPGTTLRDTVAVILNRAGVEPSDEIFEYVQDRFNNGTPWVIDVTTLGRSTTLKTTNRPSGGQVIVHTDVTALRERNVTLEHARDEAEGANQAKSNFLATMSHEIRTPMNGVVGMTDLLAETQLDDSQLSYVETIRTSALALTVLISDILDFSKIEAGHVSLQDESFDLIEMVNDVCVLVQPLAQVKSLDFEVSIDPDVPGAVKGDSLRVRQILLNLLGNAVKFTLKGGVRLIVSAESAAKTAEIRVRFDVHDTGIGIPEDKIEDVFVPFEQVDAGLQREFEGTGLGLSITRNLVQAMGGEVFVQSEFGKGSTFSLIMPFSPDTSPVKKPSEQNSEHVDFGGYHVLVAEDNRTNQMVVRRMLERAGAKISTVRNGEEACHAYREAQFDLVLMDISMPVMNGLDACSAIRKIEEEHSLKKCPIIALTGNAFARDRKACEIAGMDDFLAKPIRLLDLTKCLQRHLSGDTPPPPK